MTSNRRIPVKNTLGRSTGMSSVEVFQLHETEFAVVVTATHYLFLGSLRTGHLTKGDQ
jgi:hypothetical protein